MMNFMNPNDYWMHNYDPYKGMSHEERMRAGCMQALGVVIGFFLALGLCMLFGSCTTTKYVQVPVVHNDTLHITKYERDSIYIHDSTFVRETGDTVWIEKWHTQWRDRIQHDTLYQSKTDSIPYPVEIIKEVPAKLTWWQQTRLHLANILLWGLGIGAVVWIGKKHLGRLGG